MTSNSQAIIAPGVQVANKPFISDGKGELTLYPHQADLLRRSLASLTLGNRVLSQMATGAGKTETAFALIEEWLRRYPRARAHFIAHRRELVSQPCVRALRYGIQIENAWRPSGSAYTSERRHANSVAKMFKALKDGTIKVAPNDLLVMDEAHHAVAATLMGRLAIAFAVAGGMVIGFSATPRRLSRQQGFTEVFDNLEVGAQTSELVAKKYLAMPVISVPRGVFSQMRAGLRRRDFTANGNLKDSALTNEARWSMKILPVQKWLEYGYQDMRTIWFEQNTEMAITRAKQLCDMGKTVGLLLSDSKDERILRGDIDGVPVQRDEVMEGYAEGTLQCLVNISMVGEGVDVADTECVMLNFASLSLPRVLQAIGRALRMSPGKMYAYIVDTGANTLDPRIGSPLFDFQWSLEPQSTAPPGPPPQLASCVNDECEATVHPSARVCNQENGCGAEQGENCPRCHQFERRFFLQTAPRKMCLRCEREVKMLEDQGKLPASREGAFSRNWGALGEQYGTALSRDIINEGRQNNEWGVVVDNSDGAIANGDYIDNIFVKTQRGRVIKCQGYAVWTGQFFDLPRAAFIAQAGEGNEVWKIISKMTSDSRYAMIAGAQASQDMWVICVLCNSNLHLPQYRFCRECQKKPSIRSKIDTRTDGT